MALSILLALGLATSQARGPSLAFTHVGVIDLVNGAVLPDRTVIVEGNRITDVSSFSAASIPGSARVVDGTGKFLIPGLWDMHIHAFFGDWVPGGREVTLPLLLPHGVTRARDMGSDLEPILRGARRRGGGKLAGPRLFVSGPMLDGPKSPFPASIKVAKTPEEGRAAVRDARRPRRRLHQDPVLRPA